MSEKDAECSFLILLGPPGSCGRQPRELAHPVGVRLDFERVAAIRDAIPNTPLVLHGGSGVPDELVRRAIEHGICAKSSVTYL